MGFKNKNKKSNQTAAAKVAKMEKKKNAAKQKVAQLERQMMAAQMQIERIRSSGRILIKHNPLRTPGMLEDMMTDGDVQIELLMEKLEEFGQQLCIHKTFLVDFCCAQIEAWEEEDKNGPSGGGDGNGVVV